MHRSILLLAIVVALRGVAQPTAIQGPKCPGLIHGVVYDLAGKRAVGVRVVAFPVGVDLAAFLPNAKADQNGEYRFDHVCNGKYTVMADDPEAGYPSTFPDQNEFLYGTRTRIIRLNLFHRRAELSVYLPPKPAQVLLRVHQTQSEINKFHLTVRVPGQRRLPEETMDFDNNGHNGIPVPSGKNVILLVKAEGCKATSKSIFLVSGSRESLDLSLEPIN